jgi:uncharacterized protein YqeY
MSLITQIESDLTQALKQGDKTMAMTLRLLKSALHNEQIAQKRQQSDISDDIIFAILKREVKKRREAHEAFAAAGRVEQALAEESEMKILEKYLPVQLTVEETEQRVRMIIDEFKQSEKNIGTIMKKVMASVGSQADGKIVSEIVRKLLN